MCGIAFWNLSGLTPEQIETIITEFIPRLHPRGPDGSCIRRFGDYLFAFYRLSIINTDDSGMQPFQLDDSVLVCNGEIYNYRELARDCKVSGDALRSDVDVVLHALASGIDPLPFIDALDGDFAFVYAHKANVIVARDRAGVRPLFYGQDAMGDIVAYATEAKALYGAPGIDHVVVFPPGFVHMVPFMGGRVQCLPYVRPHQTLRGLLVRAVQKRISHSDREVGLLCSGGVDSAVITSIVARLIDSTRMHVFTMEYKGARSEDTFYARRLCEHHGFKHTVVQFCAAEVQEVLPQVVRITETYDPNTIRAAIPMYLLAKHIAENTDIKVVLSGEGSDELFAGYAYFRLAPDGAMLNEEAARLVRNIHMFDVLRADRCFATCGLEIRVPYLDKDLVNYVQKVDGDTKMFRSLNSVPGSEKALLRDAFADYDDLKSLRILDRPKEKFSDGCGFSYVPQLLAYLGGEAPDLDTRLRREKETYMRLFTEAYGDSTHWIIRRTMPDWATDSSTGGGAARNNELKLG